MMGKRKQKVKIRRLKKRREKRGLTKTRKEESISKIL